MTCYTFLPSPSLNVLFGSSGYGFSSGRSLFTEHQQWLAPFIDEF